MIITRAAQVDMMSDVLRDPCTMRLYTNEELPDQPTAGDFTEPDGGGYGVKPMRAAGWDMTGAPELAVYPKQTWTFNGPAGVIRGWYVTRDFDGRLRWFEPLSGGPMRIVNDGDEISVTVELEFGGGEEEPDEQETAEQESGEV